MKRALCTTVVFAVILSAFLASVPVAGWAVLHHGGMAHDALEGLGWTTDEIGTIPAYADEVDIMLPHPESSNHRVGEYQDIFETFDGDACAFLGAEWSASGFLAVARELYAAGNIEDAQYYLGYAIHFIQDAVCPPHVFPFSEHITHPAHLAFELYTAGEYAVSDDWQDLVRNAPTHPITGPDNLRKEVEEAADWVNTTFQPPRCSYVRHDGVEIGDLSGTIFGWKMSDEDIGSCIQKAASLVKGAAVYARFGAHSRSIAVTPPYWDSMQDVLDGMGYEYTEISLETLTDLTALQSYDVIFLNCAPVYQPVGDTFGPIREFVSQGGAVYASDFAFDYIEGAFPGYVDFAGYVGPSQTTTGNIHDEGLKAYIGVETMPIVYDLGGWVPITYVSADVTTYVSNTVSYDEATHPDTPAVIGFRYGEGYVVYTSFHHAAQDALAHKLMEYLVLIPLSADIRSELEESIREKGYDADATFVDAFDDGETRSYTYLLTMNTNLVFGVNWAGSEVTLTVTGPDGTTYGPECLSTPPLFIEVPGATPGLWTMTITGTQLPYPKYPIVLMVGSTSTSIISATIDFDPDTLNLKSKGKYVTAYIGLPTGSDVSQIDILSVRLNNTVPALTKPTAIGDYDGDSIPDLMVKFDASAVNSLLTPGDQVEIIITGEVAGIPFEGTDTIHVLDPTWYSLDISSNAGGSVMVPGEGTFLYKGGTVVSLVAVPASCYHFVNWTGDVGTIANVTDASTIITTNTNYFITANFEEKVVSFPDPNLEAAIREAIGKPTGPIYCSDLQGLTSLDAHGRSIVNLAGLEYCTHLTQLHLYDNQINNISALSGLTNLESISLGYNPVSDINALSGLTNLGDLELGYCQISDINALSGLANLWKLNLESNQISCIDALSSLTSLPGLNLGSNQISNINALSGLISLEYLRLDSNQISNVSPLSGLTNLEYLILSSNQISDITALSGLTNLTGLDLWNNQISDIKPLVDNSGISSGDWIELMVNPLSPTSIGIYIPQLQARGVTVYY